MEDSREREKSDAAARMRVAGNGAEYQVDMNAQPILATVARVLEECQLEAVLIGNAGAALHGAPVTTLDFDFLFRKTPANIRKLKRVTGKLGAIILRPYYPVSDLYRVVRDDDALQLDFMGTIHGVRSFASLRSRARPLQFEGHTLLVASLADIIRSKKAANRGRDLASLEILEETLRAKKNQQAGQAGGAQERKRPRSD